MTVWFDSSRGKWRYHFEIRKERITGYCVHPDTQEAATTERAAERIEALIHDRLKNKSSAPTVAGYSFAEAMEFFINNHARHLAEWPSVKPRTIELLEFFGTGTDVRAITEEKIADYIAWTRSQKIKQWTGGPTTDDEKDAEQKSFKTTSRVRSNTTINKYLKTLLQVLKTPAARKHIPHPPQVKMLKEAKRIPTPIDYDATAQKIMPHCAPHLQLTIIICIHTGMRETEALTARTGQFHEQQRVIYLDTATKSKKGHAVYVNEIAYQAIKQCITKGDQLWKRLQADEKAAALYAKKWGIHNRSDIPLILYTPEGKDALPRPIASIATAWANALERVGLKGKVRFHDTRAAFCSYLANLGASVLDIKNLAGHQDIKTTMRYILAADVNLRSAVDKLAVKNPLHTEKTAHENRTRKKGV
jgi:integrase